MKQKNLLMMVFFITLSIGCLHASASLLATTVTEAKNMVFKKGITPVAVFDLDETILNTMERRFYAMKEALIFLADKYPLETHLANSLTVIDFEQRKNRYDERELLHKVGINNEDFIKEVREMMVNIYLSGKYLEYDREIEGAAFYIRQLVEVGAKIYYVSSRSLEDQGEGSLKSLTQLGLMFDNKQVHLILKPNAISSTITFKRMAFNLIKEVSSLEGGSVAFVFENEPENLQAMLDTFPQATAFFIKGALLKEAPINEHAIQLTDFQMGEML